MLNSTALIVSSCPSESNDGERNAVIQEKRNEKTVPPFQNSVIQEKQNEKDRPSVPL